jgi:hypothetical protein
MIMFLKESMSFCFEFFECYCLLVGNAIDFPRSCCYMEKLMRCPETVDLNLSVILYFVFPGTITFESKTSNRKSKNFSCDSMDFQSLSTQRANLNLFFGFKLKDNSVRNLNCSYSSIC